MSNVFPSYLKPQFRAKRVTVFVFTTVLLFCSLLMTGLGPISAHASQPPSSPHQQPKQKPRKNSGRDPFLPHVQKPLKSMAGHASQTPPDVAAQLSHSGTEPFAPGSDVTFTLKVSNAATGGPIINTTTAPDYIRAIVFFPSPSSDNVAASGTDWSCDSAPNDAVCDYLGAFPV